MDRGGVNSAEVVSRAAHLHQRVYVSMSRRSGSCDGGVREMPLRFFLSTILVATTVIKSSAAASKESLPFAVGKTVRWLHYTGPFSQFWLDEAEFPAPKHLSLESTRELEVKFSSAIERTRGDNFISWIPLASVVLSSLHVFQEGAVEALALELAERDRGRVETLRDHCRTHFRHGGIGVLAFEDEESLLADDTCEEVRDELLAFYIGNRR